LIVRNWVAAWWTAIVPSVPIVPAFGGDDKLVKADWDEIDAFELMAEIAPFRRLRK